MPSYLLVSWTGSKQDGPFWMLKRNHLTRGNLRLCYFLIQRGFLNPIVWNQPTEWVNSSGQTSLRWWGMQQQTRISDSNDHRASANYHTCYKSHFSLSGAECRPEAVPQTTSIPLVLMTNWQCNPGFELSIFVHVSDKSIRMVLWETGVSRQWGTTQCMHWRHCSLF